MTFEAGPVNPAPFSIGIHVVPSFDVIDVLPQSAADRLRKLRQHVADFHALTIPFADIHEASNAKLEAERQLKRLTDHQHHGGFNLKPDDPRVIVAEQHLAKLVADQRRLNDRNETRSAAWREAGYPLVNVETWLRDGRPHGTVLQDYDGPAPKLLKNETVIDAIERLRRRGRDLNADLIRIRSAPFPSAYVRGKIKREVEALAQAGAPLVSDVLEHDRSVVWPMQRLQGAIVNAQVPSFAVTEVPDVLGLFAFLNKEQLLASLDALVSEEADDAAALTHEARQQQEAEVMVDLLAVERDESALVWRAMDERLPVEHRANCSPQAILQCRLETAPRSSPPSGSSPMHAWDIVGGRR